MDDGGAIDNSTNKYLWNFEKDNLLEIDASIVDSSPVIIGVYGDKGVGISSVTEHYLATTLSTGVTTKCTAGLDYNNSRLLRQLTVSVELRDC